MSNIWQDIRFATRVLLHNRGFAAIAILTLALGIGANTALFSVVNGVLLNPLPFPEPDRLLAVYSKTSTFSRSSISYPNFEDWAKQNHSFAYLGAFRADDYNLTESGEPERLHAHMVSADFFPAYGIKPVIGRAFRTDEDRVGAEPVAILGDGLWKRKFASSPEVLAKSIKLNGKAYSVIGVAQSRIPGLSPTDVYVPIGQWADPTFHDRHISMGTNAIGRLKPGVTPAQAQADMDAVARDLAAAYPDANKGSGVTLIPLRADVVGESRGTLLVLLGAVAFVLLIACANVGNLLLARSNGRTREFAIRLSLGAGPSRVLRQLLTESVLLGLAGGALGLIFAKAAMTVILKGLADALPRGDEVALDGRVLLFTAAISILTGIIFGLAPALRMLRPQLNETLREGGRGLIGGKHRAQSVFVVLEMAMALVLLVGAGLMVRSLSALWSINPGFEAKGLLAFATSMTSDPKATPDNLRAKYREAARQFASVPGVESVAMIGGSLPMTGDSEVPFWPEGEAPPANQNDMTFALFYLVTSPYQPAMKIPLQKGRFLSDRDDEHAPVVAVIDATFASKYFNGRNPVGQRINIGLLDMKAEIVGVVGHVEHWGLGDKKHETLQAQLYLSAWQVPDRLWPLLSSGSGYVARVSGPPLGVVAGLREAASRADGSTVVYGARPMEDIVGASIASQRLAMILLSVFSALALVLSAIGIYGVISHITGQRTQEIGIRVALGASSGDVMKMVLGDGMRIAIVGVAVGVGAALALSRLLIKLIYGVGAWDPLTFAAVAALLSGVALLACYFPARRAMRVDPMVALRYE
jgi:predicted permease